MGYLWVMPGCDRVELGVGWWANHGGQDVLAHQSRWFDPVGSHGGHSEECGSTLPHPAHPVFGVRSGCLEEAFLANSGRGVKVWLE